MQCDAVIAIRQTTRNAGWAVWLGTGLAVWGGWGLVPPAHAVDPAPTPPAAEVPAKSDAAGKTEGSIEAVAAKSKPAIVVITFQGRDGQRLGLGSGFIISPDGLVATNLHVIGEGRPISVQLADGRTFEPTVVEGYDRKFDLALLRIDAKDLPTVSLGDEKTLKQGQSVVALGNPLGLKHSLFSGLVSGNREIEGREMIQVSMPIEQGNSGGPLLDLEGRVQGIITMKSLVTANLGFAIPVSDLKRLVDKPNPTPMARWLTIGQIDPKEWKSLGGGKWRQRAGRLLVEGSGEGFGGRCLLVSRQDPPAGVYEVSVQVKLQPESGAAGLVFCSDDGDRHYGFYPSAGRLRLSRFEGPDVYSWNVLAEVASEAYRPGDWNTLRVRFEAGDLQCYVNDVLAIRSNDAGLKSGRVGLAKFRDTQAEFKHFRSGPEAPRPAAPEGLDTRLEEVLAGLDPNVPFSPATPGRLLGDGDPAIVGLRARARALERRAEQMRKLATEVHEAGIRDRLKSLAAKPEAEIDLVEAALLIARLDNEDVDIAAYRAEVDRMGRELATRVEGKTLSATDRLALLRTYLFEEEGFHGSRGEYYHRSNSYLNEVLDDREGIPITLAVLFIELGRRLELPLEGVGFPGHFLVRHAPADGEAVYFDVFDGGKTLSPIDLQGLAVENAGRAMQPADTAPIGKTAILARMLSNLLNLARRDEDGTAMLRYVEAILVLDASRGEERFIRAVLYYQNGRRGEALAEAQWLMDNKPEGVDLNRVERFLEVLERGG
jgi:serine protease Do